MRRFAAAWPAFALVVSLAMLAAAHGFERLDGLYPCHLCLKQREIYWGAAAIALAALIVARLRPSRNVLGLACVILGLVFLGGAAIAGFHVGVEAGVFVARCDAADLSDITTLTPQTRIVAQNCDTVAWRLWGVSMAGYNAMASLGLSVMSFLAAWSSRRHA